MDNTYIKVKYFNYYVYKPNKSKKILKLHYGKKWRIPQKIKGKIEQIDTLGINGDFVESQAFGYLAVRSYLKLPISFPETTGVMKPCTGGIIAKY